MISDYLVKLILEYLININYVQFLKTYTLVCKHWTYKLISTLAIEQSIEIIRSTLDIETTFNLNLLKKYRLTKYLLYFNSVLTDFIKSNFGVHIKSIYTNELLVDSLMNTQLYPNLSQVFIKHSPKLPITFLETFKISQYSNTIDFHLYYSGQDSGIIVLDINDFIQFSYISLSHCTIKFKISKISSKNRIKSLTLFSVGKDIPQMKLLLNQSPMLEELSLEFNFNEEQCTLFFKDMFTATIPWTLKVLYISEPIMIESVLVYILETVKSEKVEIYLDEVAPDKQVETIKLNPSIKKLLFYADYNIHNYIDNYENLESLNSNSEISTKPLIAKIKKLKCQTDYLWTNIKHFSETLTSVTVSHIFNTFTIDNVITLLNIKTLDRIHVSCFKLQAYNLVPDALVDSLKSNTNLTCFILDSTYQVSDYSHLNSIINILQTNYTLKSLGLPRDYEQLPEDLTLINKQLCELFTKNKTIMKTSLRTIRPLYPILDQFFIGNASKLN
ncbi:hypothetical protein DLAC_11256 [Tieghemostelium lacteum]|uniref:Uncharacterized protein n=1 Tax=Tieghemostelium lacteum TaxID=361077 RepID=A0A151Z3J3_TIELA|nr:hypothetical protein DLAC_11256 [Tieghemostelium lacteum]|eukprot:KYQ88532.1 hypothetical protein DLAC_11256 [Tieghemostelium lacteum]